MHTRPMTQPALTKSMWEALVLTAIQESLDAIEAGEDPPCLDEVLVRAVHTFFGVEVHSGR